VKRSRQNETPPYRKEDRLIRTFDNKEEEKLHTFLFLSKKRTVGDGQVTQL
jgi:hypothetical protein